MPPQWHYIYLGCHASAQPFTFGTPPSGSIVHCQSLSGDCCMFICYSGEGTVYHLDEMTGALVISHTLVISSKDYPGMPPDSKCLI